MGRLQESAIFVRLVKARRKGNEVVSSPQVRAFSLAGCHCVCARARATREVSMQSAMEELPSGPKISRLAGAKGKAWLLKDFVFGLGLGLRVGVRVRVWS